MGDPRPFLWSLEAVLWEIEEKLKRQLYVPNQPTKHPQFTSFGVATGSLRSNVTIRND